MAICAKEVKKPFYVLTESFKFARIYPLNQVDLPDEFKVSYLSSFRMQINYNFYIKTTKEYLLHMFTRCIFVVVYI